LTRRFGIFSLRYYSREFWPTKNRPSRVAVLAKDPAEPTKHFRFRSRNSYLWLRSRTRCQGVACHSALLAACPRFLDNSELVMRKAACLTAEHEIPSRFPDAGSTGARHDTSGACRFCSPCFWGCDGGSSMIGQSCLVYSIVHNGTTAPLSGCDLGNK
jgi:hypothetical protein